MSGNAIDAGSNATDPLTEAKLLDAHEAAYNAGGDLDFHDKAQ